MAEASDQYVMSTLTAVPPDSQQLWQQYRLEVAAADQAIALAAPALPAKRRWGLSSNAQSCGSVRAGASPPVSRR
jgi:hypothetical protein